MTNKEAIKALKRIRDEAINNFVGDWQDYEAFDIALKALADRKTEPNCSEKPNNSLDKDTNVRCKPNDCKYAVNPSGDVWECGCCLEIFCEHQIYDRNPDGTLNIVECGFEPKTEPQISPSDCETCKNNLWSTPRTCVKCTRQEDGKSSMYEPKTEP